MIAGGAGSFRPPNPPSPPASLDSELNQYRNMVLSFNSSTGIYSVAPVRKAFRIYMNISYNQNVANNKTAFISSISDALALFFEIPSSSNNLHTQWDCVCEVGVQLLLAGA